MIAESIRHLAVPLDSIQPHPENARKGRIRLIRESLERFGQTRPIVVQESTRYVLGGNHVFRAARSLGWEEIAAHVVALDDVKAVALMVALNRVADLGEYDDVLVLQMIDQLDSLTGTGYSPDDVADMIARLESDAEPPEEVMIRTADSANMREIVLTLGASHRDRFLEQVAKLQIAYGTDGMAATVHEAVKREEGS